MSEPLVSACLIVRDEARRLPACLDAIAGFADELVVVDTGSRDESPEIARSRGARVLSFAWCDDFSAARNHALAHARGRYALVVDADERLVAGGERRFKRRLARDEELAYSVEIVSELGEGRRVSAHITRLFRLLPDLRYEGRVHEQILGAICRRLGVEVWTPQRSGLRFTHEGYTPELRAERGKAERNEALLLREIDERPEDPGPRYLLARESSPVAGADLLDTPAARRNLALLVPAAEALAREPSRGLADPACELAARLALACGEWARAELLLERWASGSGTPSARRLFVEGERALARAARGEVGAAREAARAFAALPKAPEGSEAIPTPPDQRGAFAKIRENAAELLAGRALRLDAERMPSFARAEAALVAASAEAIAGRLDATLARLAQSVRATRDDPRLWWALGRVVERLGDAGRARSMRESAGRLAPGWAPLEAAAPSGLLALFEAALERAVR